MLNLLVTRWAVLHPRHRFLTPNVASSKGHVVLIHQCATWTAERPKKLASGSTAFINPGCEVQHDPDIFLRTARFLP